VRALTAYGGIQQFDGGFMKKLLAIFFVLVFICGGIVFPASADNSVPPETMAKIASHIKQRLDDSRDQIEMGLTKGWIKQAKADELKKELVKAYEMESDVRSKDYPKEPLANLERTLTLLNQHVTDAFKKKKNK
jgi:hypothetical protein